jgi:hypothetical protein
VGFYGVTREFFDVLGLPVVAGALPAAETWHSAPLAVVSVQIAKRFWPAGDWVGRPLKSLRHDSRSPLYTVAAVVGDGRYRAPDLDPTGAVFVPSPPVPASTSGELLLRTTGPAAEVLPELARVVDETPPWRVAWTATGDELARESLRIRRLRSGLASAFALIGLGTLGAGLLGLLLLEIGRRNREFAIRVCLGARTGDIVWLLLRTVAVPLASGGIAGVALTKLATPVLAPYLFGQTSSSGLLLGVSAAAIVTAATAAATIPAVRCSRRPPAVGLRL